MQWAIRMIRHCAWQDSHGSFAIYSDVVVFKVSIAWATQELPFIDHTAAGGDQHIVGYAPIAPLLLIAVEVEHAIAIAIEKGDLNFAHAHRELHHCDKLLTLPSSCRPTSTYSSRTNDFTQACI